MTAAPHNSRLIFVTGVHHSGTTLLRHIIGTHSRVSEVAEEMWPSTEYINSALYYGGTCNNLEAGEDCFVVVKNPFNNERKLGRIKEVLKDASHLKRVDVVAIVRDPVDVAWSVEKRRGGGILGRLRESWETPLFMGRSLKQLTSHTHFVRYEDLVDHLPTEIQRLCKDLSLPYEEGMLEYYKTPMEVTNQV